MSAIAGLFLHACGPAKNPAVPSAKTAGAASAAHRAAGPRRPAPRLAPDARLAAGSLFDTDLIGLPTGVALSPDAAPGARLLVLDPHLPVAPALRAGNAIATALSPDGSTLLVLTSGYNRWYDDDGNSIEAASGEYVFVYDVRTGAPRETGVVTLPNTFLGLAFHPAGDRFFVSGGPDDLVREVRRGSDGVFREAPDARVPLGHLDRRTGGGGLGLNQGPYAGGLDLTPSGARLVVANHENDSVSVIDLATHQVAAEIPLRPGGGVAGGEFPTGVAVVGEDRAYVSCERDREVVELDLRGARVVRRFKVGGQPVRLLADRARARLFVANANSDSVSVVDLRAGKVEAEIPTTLPPDEPAAAALRGLRGSNPNGLALSPDERTLYVTNGGNNTLAVVDVAHRAVTGLVPTGFYPSSVTVAKDGAWIYVAHAKSPTGPNPEGPWSAVARSTVLPYAPGVGNQFPLQLVHAGLLAFPAAPAVRDPSTLARLTAQALENDHFTEPPPRPPVFDALAGRVKHVIYVIGENRTYDQILGDVRGADGDPRIVHWGEAYTPNLHALARRAVIFDRFYDAGGVSGDGWPWSVSGRTSDLAEKAIPLEYANRGRHSYDWEGKNRGVNVGFASLAQRVASNPGVPPDPDLLPGAHDVGAVDGPADGGRGFLWDAALAAGLTVRDYGVFVEDDRYGLPSSDPARIPPVTMPAETKTVVATATSPSLQPRCDPYYRGFDMAFSDVWRVKEWLREFDGFVARGDLPSLELVRLPHDHLGAFGVTGDGSGVDTPDTQMADNDYAFGMLVEAVSRSRYWEDTIIVRLEDDAQNGSDHVDAHRSYVVFAGAHARRGGVVSVPYTTTSVLRTIELLLGIAPLGQYDAFAAPIAEAFDERSDPAPFRAIVPAVLRSTKLPLPPGPAAVAPRGTAAFWAKATRGFDFSHEDEVPSAAFNRLLWNALVSRRGTAAR